MASIHEPVLLHEVIQAVRDHLNLSEKGHTLWYLDGTLGGGGHALAVSEAFKGNINMIGFDADPEAIERTREKLEGKFKTMILENANFRNMDEALKKHDINSVDLILLDLGISSDELDASGRGFSFLRDEPLYMTMSSPDKALFTAKDIVNGWTEEDIANVIFAYGEEKYARRIAKAIVRYREMKKIETSEELAMLIKTSVPPVYRRSKIHPATKTFQALRIAVNDELESLKTGLKKGYESLAKGGLMEVISFHSLEDRIVKFFYKEKEKEGAEILTKRPIRAIDQEVAENPRSRSAKLRILKKN